MMLRVWIIKSDRERQDQGVTNRPETRREFNEDGRVRTIDAERRRGYRIGQKRKLAPGESNDKTTTARRVQSESSVHTAAESQPKRTTKHRRTKGRKKRGTRAGAEKRAERSGGAKEQRVKSEHKQQTKEWKRREEECQDATNRQVRCAPPHNPAHLCAKSSKKACLCAA